jgi:hypothetical protein
MADKMIVALIVGIMIPAIFFVWQFAGNLKSKVFMRFIGKQEHSSLDIDNLVRAFIFLLLIVPVITLLIIVTELID